MWEETGVSNLVNPDIKILAPHWTNVRYVASDSPVFYHFYTAADPGSDIDITNSHFRAFYDVFNILLDIQSESEV